MAELEKVNKGLECCYASFPKCKACPVCPYDKICYHDKACDDLLRDALELLKEQQPKKGHWVMKHRHSKSVKYVTGIDKWGEEHRVNFVEESEGDEPYCSECGAAAAESFLNFCPKCGADMRKDGEQE